MTTPTSPPSDPRPVPPEAPLPSDCCDSGCDPCVHDSYSEELAWYREQLARWLERHPAAAPTPDTGTPETGAGGTK